jgi:hypothetical protein
MTEGLMPPDVLAALQPEAVVPAMLVLACRNAPTRMVMNAGAGSFEAAYVTLTQGLHIGSAATGVEDAPERLLAALAQVQHRAGETVPQSGAEQGANEIRLMQAARG